MTPIAARQSGVILGTLGVLFIPAGAFGVMRMSYALCLGIASFIIAGMVKKMGGID